MIARLNISPGICSTSDKDGTTILHIEQDKIYSVIGLGSMIWAKLAASINGLATTDLIAEVSSTFKDVPRRQIERDVECLLVSLKQKGLVEATREVGRPHHSLRDSICSATWFLARRASAWLLKFRLYGFVAFLELGTINLMLKAIGFGAVYRMVKGWPVTPKPVPPNVQQQICEAVDKATSWYPRQAMCLQRSATTTCLLRQQGLSAEMVIGCRKIPFKAHAWVEVDGKVVNDKRQVQEFYSVLERC